MAKVQRLLDKHTGKAMILGKFSPVTRALMPFMVGANHTDEKRFWIFNGIGSSVWAIGSIILGYAFGAGYQMANVFTGKFILIAIGAAILIAWGYRFVNVRFHIFKRYELFILILNIVSLWGLAQTVQDILASNSRLFNFDLSVNYFMYQNVTPMIANIATWITNIGGTISMTLFGLIGGGYLLYKKKWRSASILLLSMATTGVMVEFMKEFFMRARPGNALQILTDPSFPSGHAAMAAAFFLDSKIWESLSSRGRSRAMICFISSMRVVSRSMNRVLKSPATKRGFSITALWKGILVVTPTIIYS